MQRAFANVLSGDVEQTARFYQALLGMKRVGDFGWFVVLSHDEMPDLEFGILANDHDTVPEGINLVPGGTIFTFVVPDLDQVVEMATKLQADVVQEATDMPYGQRRLMLRDPDGNVIDISSPIR